ncbi:MAG: mannose-1-phosphate guanylyltransferase [bacterium]|nr:MAG: mannose-1-phosphate guanylyltransferase [bacterium]
MRAMILAAGFGTRLWPLTLDRTKPAIPFLNKPLICYSVEYLSRFGIKEIVVNLHHKGESVRQALGDGQEFGVKIFYSEEEEILGTSGAMDHAKHWLINDTFVVMNGKVITNIDLDAAIATHRSRNAIATLVLKENLQRERFSKVLLNSAGNIEKFGAFPSPNNTDEAIPLMFTGIQILEPDVFSYIPPNQFSHSTTDVYPKAIAAGRVVAAHISQGSWYELSTLARYLDISLEFLKEQNKNIICGLETQIAKSASVTESILWQRVTIEEGTHLHQVVVGDDVRIPANTKLKRVVIVRKDKCLDIEYGEVVGENVVVPLG